MFLPPRPQANTFDDDIEPRAAAAFEQEALFERRRELRVDVVGSAVAVNDKRAGAFMSRAARRWRTDALDDTHVCVESRELRASPRAHGVESGRPRSA